MTPKEIADEYIGLIPTNNEWDEMRQELADKIEAYAQEQVKSVGLADVSGMLPLTENAKQKLEYINGSCIVRDFPKEQITKQWAGAVLDLLEELGLGNYH